MIIPRRLRLDRKTPQKNSVCPPCFLALLLAAASTAFVPAWAQIERDGVTSYALDFYKEYDPKTALELVARTPGFRIDEEAGGRGLSGISTNVLIDGLRPPPKGQSSASLLAELPVKRVERLERITSGARPEIDMQGFAQVLNIVTVAKPAPFAEAIIKRSIHGSEDQNTDGDATVVTVRGSVGWGGHKLSSRFSYNNSADSTPANFTGVDPNNPTVRYSDPMESRVSSFAYDGNGAFDLGGDHKLTIDGKYSRILNGTTSLDDVASDTADVLSRTTNLKSTRHSISAEWKAALDGQTETSVALVRSDARAASSAELSSAGVFRSTAFETINSESSMRGRVRRILSNALTVGLEGTGAFNEFEGSTRIGENGVLRDLQGGDVRVVETRAGGGLDLDWRPLDDFTAQAAIRLESYRLETAAGASQGSLDPAGRLSLAYKPFYRTTFAYEVNRKLGQLAFGQFLASSSLESTIVSFGASTLEPELSFMQALSLDYRFNERGVFKLRLERETIDNPIDMAPISASIFIAQNNKPQTIDTFSADLSYPLDEFGLRGGVLSISGAVSQSAVIDPVTSAKRTVSGAPGNHWSLGLRKDRSGDDFSWGATLSSGLSRRHFSIRNEFESDAGLNWSGFVEWTGIQGLKARISVQGGGETQTLTRYYSAPRAVGFDPYFLSRLGSDRSIVVSGSLQWQARDNIELTLSGSAGGETVYSQSLAPLGAGFDDIFRLTHPGAPSVGLQLRVTN